jgi:hypothetical protein
VSDSPVLDVVGSYRRAARTAVEADEHPLRDRYLALIDLSTAARAEPDPVVRLWSEPAIFEEAKSFLGMDDGEPFDLPPESYARAQRRLRAMGFAVCPECRSRLSTEEQFDRWSRLRLLEAEERDRRKAAVSP